MTAKEARENAIKINPQTPELEKQVTVDSILESVLKNIEEKSLKGIYTVTLCLIEYTKEVGDKLEELGYRIKIRTNEYTGSEYISISW